ncbi:zinc ribbon domain-containing protein [Phocaeicola sp.]
MSDIQQYLEHLRQEREKQMEELKSCKSTPGHINPIKTESGSFPQGDSPTLKYCPQCGEKLKQELNFCPYCGKELPKAASYQIYRLKRYEELEEESKTKIGTFERIYKQTFEKETNVPLNTFGYNDWDYAALISPLASVLEIELNLSIYPFIRQLYLKEGKKEILFNGTRIDLSSKECMLGHARLCVMAAKDKIHHQLHEPLKFEKWLEKLIATRNKADHKSQIGKEEFFKFYNRFNDFYNEYIEELLAIKKQYKHTSNKFNHPDGMFSPGEDEYINELAGCFESQKIEKHGVIFTDSSKLAVKYFGDNYFKTRQNNGEIVTTYAPEYIRKHILVPYMEQCKQFGTHYELLDIAKEEYRYILEKDHSWQGYLSVLDSYWKDYGISSKTPIGLFIIGGDDVIPMPQIRNSSYLPMQETKGINILEKDLEADMLYGFDKAYIQLNADNSISIPTLLKSSPRFHVGRLPLENGLLETDIHKDLQQYFSRAICDYGNYDEKGNIVKELGLLIKSPIVTTCQSAQKVAAIMTENLPISQLKEIPGFIENNIFISPILSLEEKTRDPFKSDEEKALDTIKETYCQVSQSADMLTFILHGAHNPNSSGYYGENYEKTQGVTAFKPDLFKGANARVVTGICCWGARFIGYKREHSALLTAIFNNVLLFVGASRSALGVFDKNMQPPLETYIPCAEAMIKYYLNYLLQGVDAGEALLQAKYKYLQLHYEKDGDGALTTFFEFNLFGDPLLHIQPHLVQNTSEQAHSGNSLDIPDFSDEQCTYNFTLSYSSEDEEKRSLLQSVRQLVDQNLQSVREKINNLLYSHYQIDPRTLYTIHDYKNKSGKQGYVFRYRQLHNHILDDTIVYTDRNGNLQRIYSTF